MAVKIVDASALAALLFGEPEAEAVVVRLGDGSLVAPALLGFEIASVCLKKLRRNPEQRNALLVRLPCTIGCRSKLSKSIMRTPFNWLRRLA